MALLGGARLSRRGPALAARVVGDPDLIFLDEPTSGLDPIGRRMVRDILRAQRERGATVFLNSHLLGEIEVTLFRVAQEALTNITRHAHATHAAQAAR